MLRALLAVEATVLVLALAVAASGRPALAAALAAVPLAVLIGAHAGVARAREERPR